MGWSWLSTAASRPSESEDLGECMIANALTDEGRAFRPDFRKVRLSESSLSTRRVFLVVGWGFGGGEEGLGAEDVDAVVGVDELGDVVAGRGWFGGRAG